MNTDPVPEDPFPGREGGKGRGTSIRTWLLLLVGAVSVPMIVLAGLTIWSDYQHQRREQEQQLLSRAQGLAASVDRTFAQTMAQLEVLAASSALARGDLGDFEKEMRRASAALQGALINLAAPDGEITLTTMWPEGVQHPRIKTSDFVLDALRANRGAISDLVKELQTGQPRVGVALPVPGDDGKPRWILSLYLPPGQLTGVLQGLHLRDAWRASIADSRLHIVARTRNQERYIGALPPPDVVATATRAESGIVDGGHRAAEGDRMLAAFARAPVSRYVVIIGLSESAFTNPLRSRLMWLGSIAAILLLTGLASARWLSQQIITALLNVGRADRGQAAVSGIAEIDSLAAQLAAAERLRDESAAGLLLLSETIPGWAHITDQTGKKTYVNKTFLRQTGLTEQQALGDGWLAAVHPEDRERVLRNWEEALRTGNDYAGEYRFRVQDGSYRWFLSRSRPLRDSNNRVMRWFGVSIDIHDRLSAEAALRESEARLDFATEAAGIGIWDWNLIDNAMTYSERAKAICEFPPDQPVTYEMVKAVTHPDDLPRTWAQARRLIAGATDERPDFEYRLLLPDGRIRWVSAFGQVVFGEINGKRKAVRFIGTIQDTTQRKLAEETLLAKEAHLRLAMEAGRMAAWEHDGETDTLTASPALYHLLGFEEGRTPTLAEIRQGFPPGELERFRAASAAELARGGRFLEYEFAYRQPRGAQRWLMLRAEFIRNGPRLRMAGVAVDVTERRNTALALQEHTQRLRDLLATIDLASVFVHDLDGTIRFWSQGCEHLYGWSAAEALDQNAHQLLKTEFPVPFAVVRSILLDQGEWTGDVHHTRRNGRRMVVSVRKVLRRDADGHPVAVLASVADVTRLREIETQLRTMNEELEARVQTEVAAREEAQARAAHAERLQVLGQLAGGIAHDFNNVLQSVHGGAMLIRQKAREPDRVARFADLILDAANRGASITRRLLAFARRGDLRSEAIDVADMLEGVREILAPALGSAVAIEVDCSADLPPLLADKGQLETALVNLGTNARDAMPDGGRLLLSARAAEAAADLPPGLNPGRYILIAVSDTGHGMTPEVRQRALEPFFTTKGIGKGTGLGLPMVSGFVQQSGGTLELESEPGQGTVIRLWLPQVAKQVARTPDPGGQPEEAAAAPGARQHVLLVDDEDAVRTVMATQLQELGFSVLTASRADQALDMLGRTRIDALVTDLSMPGMNGLDLIRAIQARRPGLPAILLTGYAGDDTGLAVSGAVTGSFSLLRKPVGGPELADRLAALLAARSGVTARP